MRKKIDISVWIKKCCKQNKFQLFKHSGVDDHQIKFGNQFSKLEDLKP